MNEAHNIWQIPLGHYCYSYKNGKYTPCPFFTYKEEVDGKESYKMQWCSLLEEELDDQCKNCGVNIIEDVLDVLNITPEDLEELQRKKNQQ